MSEKQNQHQHINLDIIPDSIKDVISDADSKKAIQAIKDRKMILLNVKDEKQKKGFAEFIDNIIIRTSISPGQKLEVKTKQFLEDFKECTNTCQPSIIDRQDFKEKLFLEELEKYTDIRNWMKENPKVLLSKDKIREYYHFRTLFINNLRKTDCDTNRNDAFVANLNRLRKSIKNKGREYLTFTHPNKNEIKKAILGKYRKYRIFKQIKKKKNRAYLREERLYQVKKFLCGKKKKLLRDKKKKLSLKELNKKYKGKSALKAKALKALEIKAQKLNKLKRNIGVLKWYYSELKRNMRILKDHFGEYFINELTEEEKEEMEKCSNNILIDNKCKIEKIMSGVKPRGKDEIYKLIMEKPSDPSALVINFKDGKVPDEFKKEFKKEFKEIKVKGKHIKAEHGELKEGGKVVYLPDEVLDPFLKEIIKEFKYDKSKKNSTYSIKDLAEIAEKRMQERIKKGDDPELCGRKSYKPNRFETFLCNLINKKPLR